MLKKRYPFKAMPKILQGGRSLLSWLVIVPLNIPVLTTIPIRIVIFVKMPSGVA